MMLPELTRKTGVFSREIVDHDPADFGRKLTAGIAGTVGRRLRDDPAFDTRQTVGRVNAGKLAMWTIEEVAHSFADGDAGILNSESVIRKRVRKRIARTVGRTSWWNPFVRPTLTALSRVVVAVTLAYLRTQFPGIGLATPVIAGALYNIVDKKPAA